MALSVNSSAFDEVDGREAGRNDVVGEFGIQKVIHDEPCMRMASDNTSTACSAKVGHSSVRG